MDTLQQPRILDNTSIDPGMAELSTLLLAHAVAMKVDDDAWGVVGEIEDRIDEIEKRPFVRIQVGRLLRGRNGDGTDRFDPIWAYDDEDIVEHIKPHHSARLSMFCRNDAERAKANENYEKRIGELSEQLGVIRAERKRIETAHGLTAALDAGHAAAEQVKSIRDEILAIVPDTLAVAAAIAAWVMGQIEAEGAYLEDEHIAVALASIGRAHRED